MTSTTTAAPTAATNGRRWAAAGLVLGTVCFIVPTVVHGNPPITDAEATLRWVAERRSWRIMHLVNIAAILLWTVSLPPLHPADAPVELKRLTRTITAIAAAVYAVYFSLHATALSAAAGQFAAGSVPPGEIVAQTDAVLLILGAVAFTGQALVGLAVGLNGLTLVTGRRFPRWVGVPAVGAGALWLIGGVTAQIDRLVVPATLITWIWTVILAILAWRRSTVR